jgi:phage-related minor tail protein
MPGKATTLVIRILADATQAATGMSKAAATSNRFASGLNKAMIPAAAVLAGLGAMGKAAAEDAHGQALLANSLRKAAGATDAQVASTEDWVSKTTLATGVADDQLRPALATLARATGDVTKSQAAMTTVLDVSAATGKDTQTVADALAKAYAGNATSLGKLVPGMNKAVLKSGDMNAIMAELARTTGGAAATAANTATGKWQRAQVAFSEAKESIGAGLLPVFDKLSGALATAGAWMANNTSIVTALAMVLGGLAAAVFAVNAVVKVVTALTRAWSAVQAILNVVMSANPIGLVIIAVAALVAGVVIAYKKSETFRQVVSAAWNGIKNAAVTAWNWIWRYVIQPFVANFQTLWQVVQLAAAGIAKAWAAIKTPLKAVWDWVYDNVIGPFVDGFDKVVGAVKKVIDWIGKIKLPSAVTKLLGLGKAAPAAVTTAPMVRTARGVAGRRAGATSTGGADRDAPPMVVNVYLDGTKVGGAIDRVVTRRFEAEGARLAAGAWR